MRELIMIIGLYNANKGVVFVSIKFVLGYHRHVLTVRGAQWQEAPQRKGEVRRIERKKNYGGENETINTDIFQSRRDHTRHPPRPARLVVCVGLPIIQNRNIIMRKGIVLGIARFLLLLLLLLLRLSISYRGTVLSIVLVVERISYSSAVLKEVTFA